MGTLIIDDGGHGRQGVTPLGVPGQDPDIPDDVVIRGSKTQVLRSTRDDAVIFRDG